MQWALPWSLQPTFPSKVRLQTGNRQLGTEERSSMLVCGWSLAGRTGPLLDLPIPQPLVQYVARALLDVVALVGVYLHLDAEACAVRNIASLQVEIGVHALQAQGIGQGSVMLPPRCRTMPSCCSIPGRLLRLRTM